MSFDASLVILTKNEEKNIGSCLDMVFKQDFQGRAPCHFGNEFYSSGSANHLFLFLPQPYPNAPPVIVH